MTGREGIYLHDAVAVLAATWGGQDLLAGADVLAARSHIIPIPKGTIDQNRPRRGRAGIPKTKIGILNWDHGIRTRRHGCTGHDPGCLAALDRDRHGLAGRDIDHNLKLNLVRLLNVHFMIGYGFYIPISRVFIRVFIPLESSLQAKTPAFLPYLDMDYAMEKKLTRVQKKNNLF